HLFLFCIPSYSRVLHSFPTRRSSDLGGIDLEFDQNLKVKDIDSKSALPNSLFAKEIRDYISNHFPNAQVMEWKRKANGQKVELNNDVELYFDENGKFIRADH